MHKTNFLFKTTQQCWNNTLTFKDDVDFEQGNALWDTSLLLVCRKQCKELELLFKYILHFYDANADADYSALTEEFLKLLRVELGSTKIFLAQIIPKPGRKKYL